MSINNYDRAARAYDNWLQTDPAMEAQAEEEAFIENIEEGISKAVKEDIEECWEMISSGTRKIEMFEFCRCLINYSDHQEFSYGEALVAAFCSLVDEYAHEMAVEAAQDPDNSRFV